MAFKSQRFDPAYLHQKQTVKPMLYGFVLYKKEKSDTWQKGPGRLENSYPGPFSFYWSASRFSLRNIITKELAHRRIYTNVEAGVASPNSNIHCQSLLHVIYLFLLGIVR